MDILAGMLWDPKAMIRMLGPVSVPVLVPWQALCPIPAKPLVEQLPTWGLQAKQSFVLRWSPRLVPDNLPPAPNESSYFFVYSLPFQRSHVSATHLLPYSAVVWAGSLCRGNWLEPKYHGLTRKQRTLRTLFPLASHVGCKNYIWFFFNASWYISATQRNLREWILLIDTHWTFSDSGTGHRELSNEWFKRPALWQSRFSLLHCWHAWCVQAQVPAALLLSQLSTDVPKKATVDDPAASRPYHPCGRPDGIPGFWL